MRPSDFLKSSKAYQTLQKIKKGTINGWRSCKPYLLTRMIIAILLILNDDKKTERHRAVDNNILFQDSVYLSSFEQSNCVRAAYSLFLLLFDLFNSFSRSVRTATLA